MIKGCFWGIIKFFLSIIIGVSLLGALAYGGFLYLKNEFEVQFKPSREVLVSRVHKIADISKVPKGYKITKAIDTAGIKAIVAKHSYNKQFMVVADAGWVMDLKETDIIDGELQNKVQDVVSKIQQIPGLANNDFEINGLNMQQLSSLVTKDNAIQYLQTELSFKQKGKAKQNLKGMIGILTDQKTKKNNLVFSFNDTNKYSQRVAETFFKNIALKLEEVNKETKTK